jgi:ArsR family transcriptional regulator
MHYTLSRESCDICREILTLLRNHANELPEAAADRAELAVFLKEKSSHPCL